MKLPRFTVMLALVLGLVLAGCFQPSPHVFEIGSTAGPVHLEFAAGAVVSGQRYDVVGVTRVDLAGLMSVTEECTDARPVLSMEIDDSETDEVLLERDLVAEPICADDRLVWNGEDLVGIPEDEPWPDTIYDP